MTHLDPLLIALGTCQRNMAAAFAVATSNFQSNPEVLIEILVVSLLGLVLLMAIAGYMVKRNGV